jgi:hypothetical protein
MGIKNYDSRHPGVDQVLLARVEALGAALRPTPVVRLANPRLNLFAKLEYLSSSAASGSTRVFHAPRRDPARRVRRTTTVIESSSGNTGAARRVHRISTDLSPRRRSQHQKTLWEF